jgi:hypothetical protein
VVATLSEGQSRSRPPPATITNGRKDEACQGGGDGANAAAKEKETMGLKPNEQNEKQPPGEGSKRADRLGFIVLVQAHYWQG